MSETFIFPASLEHDPESGETLVTFRDVPGTVTSAPTPSGDMSQLRAEAADCLEEGVAGRIHETATAAELPTPSPPHVNDMMVPLPLRMAAKLALHHLCRARGLGPRALTRTLGCDLKEGVRLLDTKHQTKIDRLADALARLGGPTLTLGAEPRTDPPLDVDGITMARSSAEALVRHGLAFSFEGGYRLTQAGRLHFNLPLDSNAPQHPPHAPDLKRGHALSL